MPIGSLDAYAAEPSIYPVDLIKIDVEGAEADVLRGVQQIIREHQPAILCEILRGVGDAAEATAVFEGTDYRFFLVTDEGLVEHEQLVGDPSYFYWELPDDPGSDLTGRLGEGRIR